MEINGVANIKMMIDSLQFRLDNKEPLDYEQLGKILGDMKNQLDVLNRYMIACGETVDTLQKNLRREGWENIEKIPFWHEVRDNPKKYPTLSEIHARGDKDGGKEKDRKEESNTN